MSGGSGGRAPTPTKARKTKRYASGVLVAAIQCGDGDGSDGVMMP